MSHYSAGFPYVFAISCGPDPESHVRIYQATLLQESPGLYSDSPPIYNISPYRIFQPSDVSTYMAQLLEPDDGWTVQLATDRETPTPPRRRMERELPILYPSPLTAPTREIFFQGHWTATGRAILSMFCSTAIPILEFDGSFRGSWPRHPIQPTSLTVCGAEVFRAWQHRWEADSWEDAIAREFAEHESPPLISHSLMGGPSMDDDTSLPRSPRASAPATAPPPRSPPQLTRPATIPTFVQDAVIRDAIARAAICPITMEPLTSPSRIALTPCFHLFDAAALSSWRASGEAKCPTCRSTLIP